MAAALASEAPAAPTHASSDRLTTLEGVIGRGLRFVEIGLALHEIADERLFAATHESFKSYLRERWGFEPGWAYSQMYGARVAEAITAAHGPLPAGLSADALRPLWPLLNREGPEAVAQAWTAVQERYGARHRPPSRSEVRTVLADAGVVTCAPERRRAPEMGQVGISLDRAATRIARIRTVLRGRALPPAARQRAAEFAAAARDLAAELEALADGSAVAARLADREAPVRRAPKPGELFCVSHGLRRSTDGVCLACGVPDLPPKR